MKNKQTFLSLACIATASLAMYGCGGDSSSEKKTCDGACLENQICNEETNTCETPTVKPECTSNDDCQDGKVCKEQKCVVDAECSFDNDCDGTLVCRNQKCVPECTSANDCEGDLVCKNQQCVPECADNDDCSDGLICQDQKCVPECSEDSDCNGAWVCTGGKCMPQCETKSDCGTDEFCHEGECKTGCVEDADCDSGYCDEDVCVDCITDDNCIDDGNGSFCDSGRCVGCRSQEDCSGTNLCDNGECVPACQNDTDCTDRDSAKPYCIDDADNNNANAVCVECVEDEQCAENQLCQDNVCKYECEKDIDCSDNKKCDTSDNKCYTCVANTDCGMNLTCDQHECVTCAHDDADCDGVLNDDEVCPYNSNIKTLVSDGVEVECNYVTDPDGTRVFEIWHPLDFIRLQEEIDKAELGPEPTENCKTPVDSEHPVIGECCDKDQYVDSCTDGKLLSCVDGTVTETPCAYGCDGDACLLCTEHEPETLFVAGNCCFDSFVSTCDSDKSLSCVGGVVVEESCAYGCGDKACNYCNTPAEDATKLKAGDCCKAETFAQVCSEDTKSSLQCIDGIVQEVVCEMPCHALSESEVLCTSLPQTAIKARLMQDINIADAIVDEELKDVPFETLKVVWFEEGTDPETNEKITITHDPSDSDYTEYAITDDTCTGRWPQNLQIHLSNVEFDGQNHRIFFKSDDDKSCSMVNSLFGNIENSYIHDLTLNYNVRGLISSAFAKDIQNSTIHNVSVVGNVNLETKPAVEEVVESYISNNTLRDNAPYRYSIMNSGTAGNTLFSEIQYKGNITTNFTLSANTSTTTSTLKMIPGFSGLFGTLDDSVVIKPAITVTDFVYSKGRAFSPIVWDSKNNTSFYNPKVSVPFVSGRTDNTSVAASFVSGFGHMIDKSVFRGTVDISFGNINTPGGFFYGLGYHFDHSTALGDIKINTGDVVTNHHYYGLFDYSDGSTFENVDSETGSLTVGDTYFGTAYEIKNVTFNGNVNLKHGNIKLNDKDYFGLANSVTNSKFNDITINNGDITGPNNFYGLMMTIPASGLNLDGTTSIETGNISDSKRFYGLVKDIKGSCKNFIIKYGDISQKYKAVSTYTMYFSGLAETLFSDTEGVVSDIKLTMGKITSPFYVAGLIHHSYEDKKVNKLRLENVELTTGDISLGSTYNFKGDFDGVCRDMGTIMRNINAKFGNVYILGTYRGCALGSVVYENSKYENVKVEVDSIVVENGKGGMLEELKGTLENVAVAIHHLQTNESEVSAITTTYANASIKNLVYYADVYVKSAISSGFINKITDATLSLENIFSAARINKYTKMDATTHKATDGKVITASLLFNALPSSAIATVEEGKKYELKLAKTQNVFWLKRNKDDRAAEKNFMSLDGDEQFVSVDPSAAEFALESRGSDSIDAANTLSGCEFASSCETPWADASHMKEITEPHGSKISIPWMK